MAPPPFFKQFFTHSVLVASLFALSGLFAFVVGWHGLGSTLCAASSGLTFGTWLALQGLRKRQLVELSQLSSDIDMPPLDWRPESSLPPEALAAIRRLQAQVKEARIQFDSLSPLVASYEQMAEHTEDLGVRINAAGYLTYATPSAQRHLGVPPADLVGVKGFDLLHPEDKQHWKDELLRLAHSGEGGIIKGRLPHANGQYIPFETTLRHVFHPQTGEVVETIFLARNISNREQLEAKLTQAAMTDTLTGLPNRAALNAALARYQQSASEQPFALFLFDLDRFKQVNDSLGHAAGDDYLVETTLRVKAALRPQDMLARIGGDEFVALLPGISAHEQANSVAHRIIELITQPYSCKGALLYPKTSIGITLCDNDSVARDDLLLQADRAMYDAKQQGGNSAVVYDARMGASDDRSFAVEQELSSALREHRLALQFQPIVNADSRVPALAEALVRMRGRDGALIPPGQFISVAEKTGLIVNLGSWVLQEACNHVMRLLEAGFPTTVSVNVSARQLLHINFIENVADILKRTGVCPSRIILEVTESAVMDDLNKADAVLQGLKNMGFKLALDDFGTGYSSLAVLKRLPFDILKIDRAFVREAGQRRLGATTLGSIIDIGKSLNMLVLAEGVETEDQCEGVTRMGCRLLQGFHFYRPMDADKHLELLANGLEPMPALECPRLSEAEHEATLF